MLESFVVQTCSPSHRDLERFLTSTTRGVLAMATVQAFEPTSAPVADMASEALHFVQLALADSSRLVSGLSAHDRDPDAPFGPERLEASVKLANERFHLRTQGMSSSFGVSLLAVHVRAGEATAVGLGGALGVWVVRGGHHDWMLPCAPDEASARPYLGHEAVTDLRRASMSLSLGDVIGVGPSWHHHAMRAIAAHHPHLDTALARCADLTSPFALRAVCLRWLPWPR